jgi:hypothetical protein
MTNVKLLAVKDVVVAPRPATALEVFGESVQAAEQRFGAGKEDVRIVVELRRRSSGLTVRR